MTEKKEEHIATDAMVEVTVRADQLPAVPVKSDFTAIVTPPEQIREVVSGLRGITELDLERIKIPAGGGIAWTIPTKDGPKPMEEFESVILHVKEARLFWTMPFAESGGGSPPDCVSHDNFRGYGRRWEGDELAMRLCHGSEAITPCPCSEFGTDKAGKGRGQACKQMYLLFVLMKDSFLPAILALPPTSLQATKRYLVNRIAGYGLLPYSVTTRWRLEHTQNKDGVEFSKAVPSRGRELSPDELERVRLLYHEYRGLYGRAQVQGEDYVG